MNDHSKKMNKKYKMNKKERRAKWKKVFLILTFAFIIPAIVLLACQTNIFNFLFPIGGLSEEFKFTPEGGVIYIPLFFTLGVLCLSEYCFISIREDLINQNSGIPLITVLKFVSIIISSLLIAGISFIILGLVKLFLNFILLKELLFFVVGPIIILLILGKLNQNLLNGIN